LRRSDLTWHMVPETALEILTKADYPDDHPTVAKTLQSLNNAHHSLSSYKNSANIVKMGIKFEDSGDLVRALKMYTIAYRIRRDNLSTAHPSLVVLLNMLASIQVKRGELEEAMEIYELALKVDRIPNDDAEGSPLLEAPPPISSNILAQSVAYREMGTINERWGDIDEALAMYHRSLDCLAEYKGIKLGLPFVDVSWTNSSIESMPSSPTSVDDESLYLDRVQYSRSFSKHTTVCKANANEDENDESGGMELFIGYQQYNDLGRSNNRTPVVVTSSSYDVFFPPVLDQRPKKRKGKQVEETTVDFADVDIAMTLHQIGQLHRAEGEYNMALSAYIVALRGMKHALGMNHPNVAAILGNVGNLYKEMGDMNAAFETYQQVLSIESKLLGLGHPDVAVTLHNIATIDAARGNHEHALILYGQVLELQKKLFGEDDDSIAVTSACMGDVYERIADIEKAIERFQEALRIKTIFMGRHSLDVSRLLHKLSKLCVVSGDYHLADSFISRAVLVYRLNKLPDDDEWLVDANRDAADIDAAITMGRGLVFEC
jgi:tetratricopeptide (TPR) repeat protein